MDDATLLQCWSVARRLAQHWNERINQFVMAQGPSVDAPSQTAFEQLATELFICDLAFRVAATLIAGREATHLAVLTESPEGTAVAAASRARPVLNQAIEHLNHTRMRVLEQILATGENSRAVERLRRCCERWTDLLIGPWIIVCGVGGYTYDPRRAWDFGEDNSTDFATPHGRQLLYASFQQALKGSHLAGKLPAAPGNVLRKLLQQLLTHATALPALPPSGQTGLVASPIETRLRDLMRQARLPLRADSSRPSQSLPKDDRSQDDRSEAASPEESLLDRCLRRLKGDRFDPE